MRINLHLYTMGLFFQQNIDDFTRLAIWKIEEDLSFFQQQVPTKGDISHPQKMLQHLAGRFLLPFLFPDFPNREIVVADTRKPYLPNEEYHFSISHSGDYAAAIVSKTHRVGIDIELFAEKIKRIEHKYLTEKEQQFIRKKGNIDLPLLTACWSLKEAVYKWWSYGNLSFKDNIRIENIACKPTAHFEVAFEKDDFLQKLSAPICLFEQMSLVWLMSEV
jgi:4'-phosphopantetheinyl transferase EntD